MGGGILCKRELQIRLNLKRNGTKRQEHFKTTFFEENISFSDGGKLIFYLPHLINRCQKIQGGGQGLFTLPYVLGNKANFLNYLLITLVFY